ncbi:uncharacterized protein LOC143917331 [Arctopsyche grandis]|uniref:uncharacterized protein LOC143917331 n=1 Tax=Arctopsyche grandis TaxID=121162 RepID=UPI00406D985D
MRKVPNYSEEQMLNAIDDVLNGTPGAAAARRFAVPRVTLMYKVRGKAPVHRRMGPHSALNKEEECTLIEWIVEMSKSGFPITKNNIFDSVQLLIKKINRKNLFINDRPGRKWFDAFIKRNPAIGLQLDKNKKFARKEACRNNLKVWFHKTYKLLATNNHQEILDHPFRVFNLDEVELFLIPTDGNSFNDDPELLTVLITGNASGELAPPFIVFKNERIPYNVVDNIPRHWGVGKSENGWMDGSLFYNFIACVFHPFLIKENIPLPIIIFVNGRSSLVTLSASEFCKSHGIILIGLLPNSTNLIHPIPIAVFDTLKKGWKTKVNHANESTSNNKNFALLLKETLADYITPSVLKDGFRKCGLVPWNLAAVDLSNLSNLDNSNYFKT